MRRAPPAPGQGQPHHRYSVVLWEGMPRIPELQRWLSPDLGYPDSSRGPRVTGAPSAGGAGPLGMQFSEVSWQPPSTQHAPYLSCAFGGLGGEARAPRSDGADWQGGARCRQSCGRRVAVLRWPGRLGFAGVLSSWTAWFVLTLRDFPDSQICCCCYCLVRVKSVLTVGPTSLSLWGSEASRVWSATG